MDSSKLAELVQVSTAFRKRAEAELARRREVDARVAAGAPKVAAALVADGIVPASRRAEAEAALRDPVKAQGLVASLARKLAKAAAAPAPIGAPEQPAVKQASAADPAAADRAQADARWSQALAALAVR